MLRIKKYLFTLIIFVVVGGTMACSESKIEILDFGKAQLQISNIISSRVQIYNVEYKNNILSIELKDNVISIDTRLFPYVCLDKDGYWTVNGSVIKGYKVFNTTDEHIFPSLSISEKGCLLIDCRETSFAWETCSWESIPSNSEWIWAVARIGSYLCFYRNDDNNIIIPIAHTPSYIIPDYFFDLVVEKELLAEESVKSIADEEKLSYVFFTDAHWGRNQKHSPAIIKHIVDYTPINQVLFGGDVNTNRTETVQGTLDIGYQFQNAFSFLGPRFYCLYGNHDDNSSGQPSLTDRHLTEEQVYGYLQSQMTNVHYWDYYNFYYDDPISKTRFICMDTGRLHLKAFREATIKTAKFAIECLSAVPDGWHIVAASHIWANLKSFETGEMKESTYVRPIIEILENYNMREKSTFKYDGETLDYDFTRAGATIEYCIGGHTHSDGVVMSKKGLPLIIVMCDGQQEVAGGAPYKTGTVNEQCVTIVVNNYIDRKVQLYRIGRGSDISVPMWEAY